MSTSAVPPLLAAATVVLVAQQLAYADGIGVAKTGRQA